MSAVRINTTLVADPVCFNNALGRFPPLPLARKPMLVEVCSPRYGILMHLVLRVGMIEWTFSYNHICLFVVLVVFSLGKKMRVPETLIPHGGKCVLRFRATFRGGGYLIDSMRSFLFL